MSQVDFLLTVGKLDASLALLTTDDHHVIEFPTVLLPNDVKAGSIVKLSVSQTFEEEKKQRDLFREIQAKILEKYGTHKPSPPVLKVVNVTQTSCVLAWDPLQLGSASLKSLVLYRQGVRSTVIPCPLKTNTTKISGLSVDTDYEFELKLTTTSGQLWSQKVKTHTHKMTDMSGITACLGPLDPLLGISGAQVAQSLSQIGARPMQRKVAIDTTHFITNDVENDDDPELIKAKNSNIPIVRPEWVRASEMERRIVGVRGFYLDADPGILRSYPFPPTTDEAKALFAKIKAGETTENLNVNKELPEPKELPQEPEATKTLETVQNGLEAEEEESPQITERDLKDAAEQLADESREQSVEEEKTQESPDPQPEEAADPEVHSDVAAQASEDTNASQQEPEREPVAEESGKQTTIPTTETTETDQSKPEDDAATPGAPESEVTKPSDEPIPNSVDIENSGIEQGPTSESADTQEQNIDIAPRDELDEVEESLNTPEEHEEEEEGAQAPLEKSEIADEPEISVPAAELTSEPATETDLGAPTELSSTAQQAENNTAIPEPQATKEETAERTPDNDLNREQVEVAELEEGEDESETKESSPSAKKNTKKNKKKKNKKKK